MTALMPTRRGAAADPQVEKLAKALGWMSLGLAVTPLAAPDRLSRQVGVDDTRTARAVVRALGVRELLHASGLLLQRPYWVFTRVAGDAMDLTMLGRAMADRKGWRRRRTAMATAAIVGITAADLYAAARTTRASLKERVMELEASITINASAEQVYSYWRDFERLPTFMAHLESVQVDGNRSHWVATAPMGRTIEWDAEMTDDVPNERISWKSVGGSVSTSGSVRFAPAAGNRGTEVRVQMRYSPPAGRLGAAVAKLFGEEPKQQVRDDLRRLKQVLETGEVVRSEGSPEGLKAKRQLAQHPAQPLSTV
jgi:uncharacterized membrane protein